MCITKATKAHLYRQTPLEVLNLENCCKRDSISFFFQLMERQIICA